MLSLSLILIFFICFIFLTDVFVNNGGYCRLVKYHTYRLVKNDKIIWQWYNTPPKDLESQRRCTCDKNSYHRKVTDKTCCIHAEQRAIMDALKNHPKEIEGSDLYFIRLDKDWNPSKAWKPYCTICSKMALDTWVKHFLLRHEEWITQYNTEEYNLLSYQYCE